jgi:pimeloyl-ACP methyl ester carboxylesterase
MSRLNSIARACRLALLLNGTALSVLAPPSVYAGEPVTIPSSVESCRAACVETRFAAVGQVSYAYRSLGEPVGVPLVLLNRFRGTMDEWDPAFLDRIAQHRHVVIFDNVGVARTNGVASPRLQGWADGAADLVTALGYDSVDIMGFSFGGLVAQELTLRHPELVRRLVIVGSGAGYVEGANLRPSAIEIATRPVNTDEDFLALFFRDTPASQAAGRAHLSRLRQRSDAFAELVSADTWKAMLSAGGDVGTAETSLLTRSGAIRQPTLIANGVEDAMIPTYQSYALAQVIPNARLSIYPDSGHAFMFQYPEQFGDDVVRFLSEEAGR